MAAARVITAFPYAAFVNAIAACSKLIPGKSIASMSVSPIPGRPASAGGAGRDHRRMAHRDGKMNGKALRHRV
ncbi:MAG: hypothetical protein WD825_04110 [Gemmatimonadaceae bacterium]